jgi:hypothetical protein
MPYSSAEIVLPRRRMLSVPHGDAIWHDAWLTNMRFCALLVFAAKQFADFQILRLVEYKLRIKRVPQIIS